jgi:hypothetical protein
MQRVIIWVLKYIDNVFVNPTRAVHVIRAIKLDRLKIKKP